MEPLRPLTRRLALAILLAHAPIVTQAVSVRNVPGGADMTEQARLRSALFESVVTRNGFRMLPGRYGGDFQSDQLALQIANGKTTLVLGLLTTSPGGDLQLDRSSMGGHMQFSREWIIGVARALEEEHADPADAETIRNAFREGKLYLGALIIKPGKDVIVLRIETPKY
jgi:hypothetical protein